MSFKKGDRVRCVEASMLPDYAKISPVGAEFEVCQVTPGGLLFRGVDPLRACDPSRFELVKEADVASSRYDAVPQGAGQAMRANTGKPQLSYLLSFKNGVEFAFSDSSHYESLVTLGTWYRGEESDRKLYNACSEILDQLDDRWPLLLCQVSEFGANKYARGNYLKGMNWSRILDSLLRHILQAAGGEELDQDSGLSHDGHIAWNVQYLLHCVECFPELDDRLRAP